MLSAHNGDVDQRQLSAGNKKIMHGFVLKSHSSFSLTFKHCRLQDNKQCKAIWFCFYLKLPPHPQSLLSSVSAEMTAEVHICSSQVLVGVQIEAMIYDMCCKQSLCISQGPVTAPAQALKGSDTHSLILHLGHNLAERNQAYLWNQFLLKTSKKK